MEDIYTIKIRTNPDPRELYPSERRYSASTVLGLSVVHLSLAITALLLASLSLNAHRPSTEITKSDLPVQYQNFTDFMNSSVKNTTKNHHEDFRNDDMAFLDEDVEIGDHPKTEEQEVMLETNGSQFENFYSPFVSLTLGPCFMALGALLAGSAGLLAWKRWYIDQNIKWFFFMSSISVVTSIICLVITSLILIVVSEQQNQAMTFTNSLQNGNAFIFSFNDNNVFVDRLQHPNQNSQTASVPNKQNSKQSNIRMVLAVNLLITTILELIWSILSSKIAWKGMRNSYPDDIILARGKLEVNTVSKGNKKSKAIAPDILNHYPKKKKFAKYFPKKEDDFLPKRESNIEYQERVNKFLSSNIHEPDN